MFSHYQRVEAERSHHCTSLSQVVRSQNFNERIGRVRAADVALLVGEGTSLEPITLERWLMLVVN